MRERERARVQLRRAWVRARAESFHQVSQHFTERFCPGTFQCVFVPGFFRARVHMHAHTCPHTLARTHTCARTHARAVRARTHTHGCQWGSWAGRGEAAPRASVHTSARAHAHPHPGEQTDRRRRRRRRRCRFYHRHHQHHCAPPSATSLWPSSSSSSSSFIITRISSSPPPPPLSLCLDDGAEHRVEVRHHHHPLYNIYEIYLYLYIFIFHFMRGAPRRRSRASRRGPPPPPPFIKFKIYLYPFIEFKIYLYLITFLCLDDGAEHRVEVHRLRHPL